MDEVGAAWRKRESEGEDSSPGPFGRLGKRLRTVLNRAACINPRFEIRDCTAPAPFSPGRRGVDIRHAWPVHGTGLPVPKPASIMALGAVPLYGVPIKPESTIILVDPLAAVVAAAADELVEEVAAGAVADVVDTVAAGADPDVVDDVVAGAAANVADVAAVAADVVVDFAADALANPTFTEEELKHLPPKRAKPLGDSFEYDVYGSLGEGTFGDVFKGRRPGCEWVAIKRIKETNGEVAIKYIQREWTTMKDLKHENIVRYIEGYTYRDRQVFIHMELGNIDLEDFCGKLHGGMAPVYVKTILKQILSGATYMHRKKVLHRDLKLNNIIIFDHGVVKITDFGFGRYFEVVPSPGNRRHYSGLRGTRIYMAPEMLMNKHDYGSEVDVWSIGVIAYELFMGDYFMNPTSTSILQTLQFINYYVGDIPDVPDDIPFAPPGSSLKTGPALVNSRLYTAVRKRTGDFFTAQFIERMLTLDQSDRPSADAMLPHRLFTTDPLPASLAQLANFITLAMTPVGTLV